MGAAVRKLTLKAADVAGALVRGLPGMAGAACVCAGLGLIYMPAGVIAAGVFLLIIDYRRP